MRDSVFYGGRICNVVREIWQFRERGVWWGRWLVAGDRGVDDRRQLQEPDVVATFIVEQ